MLNIKHLRGGDYITPNLCLNSETWETKCEPEEEEVNLITFTIDGTEYQAEEGMTWGEWVNSEYNTLNINLIPVINDRLGSFHVTLNGSEIKNSISKKYIHETELINEQNYTTSGVALPCPSDIPT